ncbi:hypothetical protein AB0C29_15850 [Actinoplanes sp. NPDC048791]|uniref:hypothetical protein n=1 Tax=Actinoplanes sp. NPDC048791 TaxID=3154623 RepID=UPI0033E75117
MAHARTWTVEITITEQADERRPSSGQDGDDPATARALAVLAYKALTVGAADLEQVARPPMRMLS